MKILQIAPIYIPIKPDLKYGGIERVVLALGKAFKENGHEVITAAPADSYPYGELLPTLLQSEWTKPKIEGEDPNAYEKHVGMIIKYIINKGTDIVHDHTGNFVLSRTFKEKSDKYSRLKEIPIFVTPHELKRFKKISPPKQRNILFTALSKYQKKVFSDYADVKVVINNGVFVEEYPFNNAKKDYLFSLGSIEKDKGQDLAVQVALETGLPLKIGGKIAERDFFDLEIKPHLDQVEYVGDINDEEKKTFYKSAKAFIAPIRIGDCFTLTRVESLACGTPVVTLNTGSAKEAIKHGKTGYLVGYDAYNEKKAIEDMANYIRNIEIINPSSCRKDAEERFEWGNISEKYINLYEKTLSGRLK